MVDVVVVAMLGVLATLAVSVWLVRSRKCYALHKQIQLALALALLSVVALFEAEVRINGWRGRAETSPYYNSLVMPVLAVHLVFSISTCLIWLKVIVDALRKYDNPPRPGPHSASHRFWAWLAAIDMVGTAVSGWTFYWLAFAAR